jgi:aspartate ammonia-lyase
MSKIKQAAAFAHLKSGEMDESVAKAIITASREVQSGLFDNQFFLPGLQGGAGTSLHMNVNEVIASRASEILMKKGIIKQVHPNDHVNKSQSTNDVGPSALKIASLELVASLLKTLSFAGDVFEQKAEEFKHINKLGRTHLQDAVPTTLGAEFLSYAATIRRGQDRLLKVVPFFYELNLSGTAVGNAINASILYREQVYKALRRITKMPVKQAPNMMSQTSSQTDFVMLSQTLVAIMLDFSKIANDLRLLASGPNGGFGEIKLKELQSGSSIMPGKVNPILPESVNQAYFAISGNNVTIEHAAQAAQLELGVMFPVIADRLIASLKLSQEVIQAFVANCVMHITANEEKCKEHLEKSTAYATMLTPKLGYEEVSKMVKASKHNGKTLQETLLQKD